MNTNSIGILAGMGPRSTAPFIDLLVDECQRQYDAKNDIDFPHMLIYSLPTPFYIDKPIDHNLMKKTIVKGLRKLENIGVNFIVMPCNSAHIYFHELESSINIPLLNIVDETIKNLNKKSQKVTLFATSSTYQSEIYQNGIVSSDNTFIFKEVWQLQINEIIKEIKINKYNDRVSRLWNSLIEDVKKESVDSIIVACTDLNIILKEESIPLNVIDSSLCLAKATISEYLKLFK